MKNDFRWKPCAIAILWVLTLASCHTTKKELTTEKWFENPNGQSELASTMREMYDALKVMEYQIVNGKKIKEFPNFDHMLTDTPTDPDLKRETFDPFAKAWLTQLETLKASARRDQKQAYTDLVNLCVACHDQVCPGPVVRIKKLYVSE